MALKKSTKKFIVSEESKNAYGFSVQSSGIKIEEFLKNPVCLLNHNYDKVIALWEDLTLSGTIYTSIPAFDENDPEAMLIAGKVEDGLIKGASIGITPLAWDGDVITECILKEISITPLPANKNAVVLYDQKGVQLNEDQAKQYLLSLKPTENPITEGNKEQTMNEKTKKALIALAVHLGVTLSLSDSEEKFEEIATNATSKIQDLKNQLTTLSDGRATKLVDDAIAAKKITAGDKEVWLSMAKTNYDLAEKTLSSIPAVELNINNNLNTGNSGNGGSGAGEGTDPRANWTFDDYASKDSAALEKMQLSEPQKFQKLLSDKQNSVRSKGRIAL